MANELLAVIAHSIQVGNWQRGNGKGPRPKRIRLNGETDPEQKRIGTALSMDDMRQVLDNWSEGAVEAGVEAVR